jgi:hypothetical protein
MKNKLVKNSLYQSDFVILGIESNSATDKTTKKNDKFNNTKRKNLP